jgi:hypothetical protein
MQKVFLTAAVILLSALLWNDSQAPSPPQLVRLQGRHRYRLDESELVSLRGCRKALFGKEVESSGESSKLEL